MQGTYYPRFRFTSSCNISSEVVITLEFAWNPLSVMIIFTISSERSTLDISREEGVMVPVEPVPAVLILAVPELDVLAYMLEPSFSQAGRIYKRSKRNIPKRYI